MKNILLFILTTLGLNLFVSTSFAQNSWGPVTRPISRILADIAPNTVNFENNLMNHISDELRVDDSNIRKGISCYGDANGVIEHHKSGRHVRIQCENTSELAYVKRMVSGFYSKEIGGNLKYAFKSGPYIFALCNYDKRGKHAHSKDHYVCRVPVNGESQESNMETYCYNMGLFHRTCNPHKALVATEIITINSTMRWETIDKTILARFIGKNVGAEGENLAMIQDLAKSRVKYNVKSRGAADADIRYPKFFIGKKYACVEQLLRSSRKYVETKIDCGDISQYTFSELKRLSSAMIQQNSMMSEKMKRLKQIPAQYPMLGNMKSSVDF